MSQTSKPETTKYYMVTCIRKATHFDMEEETLWTASTLAPVSVFLDRAAAERAIKRTIKDRVKNGMLDEWAKEEEFRILPVKLL